MGLDGDRLRELQTFAQACDTAGDEVELYHSLLAAVKAYNVDLVVISEIISPGKTMKPRLILGDPTEPWLIHFKEQNLHQIDKTIFYGFATDGPYTWDAVKASLSPKAQTHRVYSDAEDFGLTGGLCITIRTEDNGLDYCTMAGRNFNVQDGSIEATSLRIMITHAHGRLTRLKRYKIYGQATITEAEWPIISMLGDGMQIDNIAHRLGVTSGAVNQHIRNLKNKTGTRTTPSLILDAARRGWLA